MAYFSSYGSPAYGGRTINYFSNPAQYSGLEQKVYSENSYSFNAIPQPMPLPMYVGRSEYQQNNYSAHSPATYLVHNTFLNAARPLTQFIRNAAEVQEIVEKTFKLTTGDELPKDFTIEILPEDEFKKFNKEQGVLGFAINRKKSGNSRIVIKQNNLDMLMIVIGHEIGHILTLPAMTVQDEEAKAFSFQFAWAKAVFENDIAGLRMSINSGIFNPANNGIHDVAFSFVQKLVSSGRKSLEVYGLIAAGLVGVKNWGLIDFS